MLNGKVKHFVSRCMVFFTMLAFVLANVGLAVYTHSCSISGVEKSFYVQLDDPCSDTHPVVKKSCCSKEVSKEVHFEKSCCSTDTDVISLDVDSRIDYQFTRSVATGFETPFFDFFDFFKGIADSEKQHVSFAFKENPPPKLQGRSLQQINQVFVI